MYLVILGYCVTHNTMKRIKRCVWSQEIFKTSNTCVQLILARDFSFEAQVRTRGR